MILVGQLTFENFGPENNTQDTFVFSNILSTIILCLNLINKTQKRVKWIEFDQGYLIRSRFEYRLKLSSTDIFFLVAISLLMGLIT